MDDSAYSIAVESRSGGGAKDPALESRSRVAISLLYIYPSLSLASLPPILISTCVSSSHRQQMLENLFLSLQRRRSKTPLQLGRRARRSVLTFSDSRISMDVDGSFFFFFCVLFLSFKNFFLGFKMHFYLTYWLTFDDFFFCEFYMIILKSY